MSGQDLAVSVKNLVVEFSLGARLFGRGQTLRAVNDVSLDLPRGAFFGLVGESGCGKTTLGQAILGAAPIAAGTIGFTDRAGEVFPVSQLDRRDLKRFRRRAQMIFQDPYAALSPRMTVRDIIAEPLEVQKLTASRAETDEKTRETARLCRLNVEHLRRFPHAFSGGQRQRIAIARALVTEPEFIVADESVAALDVSTQADILNMLKGLRDDLGLTVLFISHDLSVVGNVCDQVAVMYLGRIVEQGATHEVFRRPRHPYTRALFSAVPRLDPRQRGRRDRISGEVPSPANPPKGCAFHPRCRFATALCQSVMPEMRPAGGSQRVACHNFESLDPVAETGVSPEDA